MGMVPAPGTDPTAAQVTATLLAMIAGCAKLRYELDDAERSLAQQAYAHGATTDQLGAVIGITGEGARKRWRLQAKGKRIPAKKVAEGLAP